MLGGIRLAAHAAPTATNTGANTGSQRFRRLYGTHEPFDAHTLAELYPGRESYVDAVEEAVAANLAASSLPWPCPGTSGRSSTRRAPRRRPSPSARRTNVWATLPGMTDEKIVIVAHRDGWFEGANDNAAGVATTVGLAEYFAALPRERGVRVGGSLARGFCGASLYGATSPSNSMRISGRTRRRPSMTTGGSTP